MPREDWRDRPAGRDDFGQGDYSTDYGYDPRRRAGYRAAEDVVTRTNDYGQADYSTDFAYDRETGKAYRRNAADIPRTPPPPEKRSFGGMFGPVRRDHDERATRRKGPSDRVLWTIIVERLEDERKLDLRDVQVSVHGGEVTLDGTVRHKDEKRRIEDVADVEGVRHVQNNLRVRDGSWF